MRSKPELTYLEYVLLRLAVIDKIDHLREREDYRELLEHYERLRDKLSEVVK